VPVLIGDATVRETLVQARAGSARAVIACTSADLANLEVALMVAELNEQQRVVVRLGDTVLADTARTAAGVKMALSLPELAAPAFVAGLIGDRVLSMFLVGGRMLTAVELTVQPDDAAFVGHSLRVLAVDYGVAPVAVVGPDGKARDVDAGYRLAIGDRFIVVATVPDLERITQRVVVLADWAVEVTAYPMTGREGLVLQARVLRGLSAESAGALVGATPFVIAERQTRGQAEELVGVLQREKVSARAVRAA
jgi:Trk K+ transport system NAD-binding subunit